MGGTHVFVKLYIVFLWSLGLYVHSDSIVAVMGVHSVEIEIKN